MDSEFQNSLHESHSSIRYRIINLICQTLLYGIYFCLLPIAIHVMVTNGLQGRLRKWLLAIISCMFALSTVYWILSVLFTFLLVDSWDNSVRECFSSDNTSSCILSNLAAIHIPVAGWVVMFNAILLLNYIIANGIIFWRAWNLCFDQSRAVLVILVVTLSINTVIYLMMVVVRAIVLNLEEGGQMNKFLNHMLDGTQLAYQALTLLINISVTSIIALKAWKCRKLLMESGIGVRTLTKAVRILAVLVESGIIYILIGVASLASITISLHLGLREISDIFMPVGIQLVGIYPVIIVLLVEQNYSLNSRLGTIIDTHEGRPSQLEPMVFAPGPVIASGRRIDLTTKTGNSDIHVTLDPTFDPGDLGMGTGSSKFSNEGDADC